MYAWRSRRRLGRRDPQVAGEIVVVVVLLGGLCALAFGAQLQPGGFYNDDWSYLVTAHYSGGFAQAVDGFGYLSFRPLMQVYWPALYGVLGIDPTRHVAWLLAVSIALAVLVYALLRRVRVHPIHAGLLAALALVSADANSTRFWPCMSANVGSVALYVGGVVVSLRAFELRGRRAVLAHAAGVALLVASMMLYEITIVLGLVGGLLYLLREGRRGACRWAVDAAATAVVIVVFTRHTFYDPVPIGQIPSRMWTVARDAAWVLTDSLWAPANPSWTIVAVVWLAIAAILVLGWRRGWRRVNPSAPELRRWTLLAVGALVAAGAAYATIVPSTYLSPSGAGQLNRANVAGGIALFVLLYATLMVLALLATARMRSGRRWAIPLVCAAAVAILASHVVQDRHDQRLWERAALTQEWVVQNVASSVGLLPHDAVVVTYDAPVTVAPGVPVFAAIWDLSGALTVRYDDPSVVGYPALPGSRVECGPATLTLHDANDAFGRQTGRYGQVYVVDVSRRRAIRVTDGRSCRAAGRALSGTGGVTQA